MWPRLWIIAALCLVACGTPTAQLAPLPIATPSPVALTGRLTFAGSTTVQPLVQKLAAAFGQQQPGVMFEIAAGGSVVGITAVQDGTADVGMASRELSAAEAQGITTQRIASDALVVIVHPQNTVRTLTRAQLRDIYLGKILRWSALGGADTPIIVLQRAESSGTRGAFDELALAKGTAAAPQLVTLATAGEIQSRTASDAAAIGYVGFGNLDATVQTVAIDGVAPSPATVGNQQYPLVRPLSLLTGPLSIPLAQDFLAFVLSPAGQQLVTEDGWVAVR